ncbi:MAG: hypothetical protein K0R28_2079 [Paenibacillus sp.]|nr:hypothetical protein [Paenibacillus sp.]
MKYINSMEQNQAAELLQQSVAIGGASIVRIRKAIAVLSTQLFLITTILSCKPSQTSPGTSLTLISPPRKSSQFVISANSSE